MSRLRHNIIANYGASVWVAITSVLFAPLYIKFMGMESYGLVGMYTTLVGVFAILDLGLSATLSRELARCTADPELSRQSKILVRTLEYIYWGLAILILVVIVVLSNYLSTHWVHPEKLSVTTIRSSIILMGLIIFFQWPFAFYTGGLLGLQQQVLSSTITVIGATLRGVGAVFILWLISPTIKAFFLWQMVTTAMTTLATWWFLWRKLPGDAEAPRFDRVQLLRIWRFVAGLTGISIIGMLILQLDKIILSRTLSLTDFGYYSLAASVAAVMLRISSPLYLAYFPRLTHEVTRNNLETISNVYHSGSQLMSVLLMPCGAILTFFAPQIFFAWTGDYIISDHASVLLALLAIGTTFRSLAMLPWALQQAYGVLHISMWVSIIQAMVSFVSMVIAAKIAGAVGVALVWSIIQFIGLIAGVVWMHQRLLPGHLWKWFMVDNGIPAVSAYIGTYLLSLLVHVNGSRWLQLTNLVVVYVVILFVAFLFAPATRRIFRNSRFPLLY